MAVIRVVIGLILMVSLVLLPSGIALIRRHRNFVPILLLNVLLGITGIGWIAALIWSFTSNVKEKRSVIEVIKALQDGSLAKEQD